MLPWPGVERFAQSPLGAVVLVGSQRLGLGPATLMQLSAAIGFPRAGFGYLPPSQDGDRIHQFNNPNKASFPSSDSGLPYAFRNILGYITYTQFLMDHGRDLSPDGSLLGELSFDSGRCSLHNETVAGRSFQFPPRAQPVHAARRSMIASMDVVATRNGIIPGAQHRDRVAVVTFDTTAGSRIHQNLTTDYVAAMESVTKLQSVGDKSTTTATESGLILAHQILRKQSEGGQARDSATRVTVLLTDGIPNTYESSNGAIDTFLAANPGGDFYGGGYYWLDAALMQGFALEADKIEVYPVGVGLGTDYDFMDRMARTGGTADSSGQSPRGSGNPAEYEARMLEIFEKIIKKPVAKLVE